MSSRAFACIILSLTGSILNAQPSDVALMDSLYRVHIQDISTKSHTIIRPEALSAFFDQLAHIADAKDRQVVRIAHIGDSHIQADYLPQAIRTLFWQDFGNAGRGLVFPYRLAGTHGPLDYEWRSREKWTARRRTFQKNAPPIGVTGMGLQANQNEVSLTYQNKASSPPFNRIQVFSNQLSSWSIRIPEQINPPRLSTAWTYHEVIRGETLYSLSQRYACTIADLQLWNGLTRFHLDVGQKLRVEPRQEVQHATYPLKARDFKNTTVFEYDWSVPVSECQLIGRSNSGPQLFGIQLENTRSSGVLYHMIGVNGTTFFHYNRDSLFVEQLAILQPDLIILTLGTNEALQDPFDARMAERSVRHFLRKLKTVLPSASIVLMTNPDLGNTKRGILDSPAEMRALLLRIAQEEQIAVYDLFAVMGGAGSIYRWKTEELAYKDYIHFTKKGYTLLGRLLYSALMEAYHGRD